MLAAPATPMTPVASAPPSDAEPGSQDANSDRPGAAAAGQAGEPGSPASCRPAAAPGHDGRRRAVELAYAGGSPPDRVGSSTRLAGGSVANTGGPADPPTTRSRRCRFKRTRFNHGRTSRWRSRWNLISVRRPDGPARLAARRSRPAGRPDRQGRHLVRRRHRAGGVEHARTRRRGAPGGAGGRIPVAGPRRRTAFRRRLGPADHHRDGIGIPARQRRGQRDMPRGYRRARLRPRPGRLRDGRPDLQIFRTHPGQRAHLHPRPAGHNETSCRPTTNDGWMPRPDLWSGLMPSPRAGRGIGCVVRTWSRPSWPLEARVADPASLAPEHMNVLQLARAPTTVADIASDVDLPLGVVRIILADLRELGLVAISTPVAPATRIDTHTLREVLNGLRGL